MSHKSKKQLATNHFADFDFVVVVVDCGKQLQQPSNWNSFADLEDRCC